jgi:hypothetical protein
MDEAVGLPWTIHPITQEDWNHLYQHSHTGPEWDQQQLIETLLRQDHGNVLLAMLYRMDGGGYQQNVELRIQAPICIEQTTGDPKRV